ncbi:MAG: SIR2 family protein [Kiritimatiellae bacterium]|nr:SIR2 family protein [Kiritimatiellia bacterium]
MRKSIDADIDYIANRLMANRAVVLVGAGFSRNSDPEMPLWWGLAKKFCEVLRLREDQKPSDILDLAEEVESELKRSTLNAVLETTAVPRKVDLDFHVKLLKLPWADVLTTNYDTLLEKARHEVLDRRYGLVTRESDLPKEHIPRIIKLHGSFRGDVPARRPYVITKEDYRKYPLDFPCFVNTVRQDMMENTLCLVGFSGTDPNFLGWLGWIRDVLGKNGCKVYLIGQFAFRKSEIKLLERRKIHVVNYAKMVHGCADPNKEAMRMFLDGLAGRVKRRGWIDADVEATGGVMESLTATSEEQKSAFRKVIMKLKTQRNSYPGWEMLPNEYLRRLWHQATSLIRCAFKFLRSDSTAELHAFVCEMAWVLQKCHYALSFSPKLNALFSREAWARKDSPQSVDLFLYLMESCRLGGDFSEWERIENHLSDSSKLLNSEQRHKLSKERVLCAIYLNKLDRAETLLREWSVAATDGWWVAQKTALEMSVSCDQCQSEKFMKSVSAIRDCGLDKYGGEDMRRASQESIVMTLCYLSSLEAGRAEGSTGEVHIREEYHDLDRWAILRAHKCSFRDELGALAERLSEDELEVPGKERGDKRSFRVGETITIPGFSWRDHSYPVTSALLVSMEQAGVPLRFVDKLACKGISAEKLVAGFLNLPLGQAMHVLSLVGIPVDKKGVFSRAMVGRISSGSANIIANSLVESIRIDRSKNQASGDMTACRVLALGCLCCRIAALETKRNVAATLVSLYDSDFAQKRGPVLDEAFSLLVDSLQKDELEPLLPICQDCPCPPPYLVVLREYACEHPMRAIYGRWGAYIRKNAKRIGMHCKWSRVLEDLYSQDGRRRMWAACSASISGKMWRLPPSVAAGMGAAIVAAVEGKSAALLKLLHPGMLTGVCKRKDVIGFCLGRLAKIDPLMDCGEAIKILSVLSEAKFPEHDVAEAVGRTLARFAGAWEGCCSRYKADAASGARVDMTTVTQAQCDVENLIAVFQALVCVLRKNDGEIPRRDGRVLRTVYKAGVGAGLHDYMLSFCKGKGLVSEFADGAFRDLVSGVRFLCDCGMNFVARALKDRSPKVTTQFLSYIRYARAIDVTQVCILVGSATRYLREADFVEMCELLGSYLDRLKFASLGGSVEDRLVMGVYGARISVISMEEAKRRRIKVEDLKSRWKRLFEADNDFAEMRNALDWLPMNDWVG